MDVLNKLKLKILFHIPFFVTSGVHQGSCLGSTLFLLYINDLVDCFDSAQCNIKLYADDAKLYSSYRLDDSTLSVDLNLILERLVIWAKTMANANCI